MAGYFIYSLDSTVFQQLITEPTPDQCDILAARIEDDLEDALEEYDDEDAASPKKWPLDPEKLSKAIRKRLVAPDWYADLTMGDGQIWDSIIFGLIRSPGKELGIGFQNENDGNLYWDAAQIAAQHGATMMAEPSFGNSGFRYSGKSKSPLELMYSIYLPNQVEALLAQLEKVAPHFETLPNDEDGDRAQFLNGLLEPVRKIAKNKRVMFVQTDT